MSKFIARSHCLFCKNSLITKDVLQKKKLYAKFCVTSRNREPNMIWNYVILSSAATNANKVETFFSGSRKDSPSLDHDHDLYRHLADAKPFYTTHYFLLRDDFASIFSSEWLIFILSNDHVNFVYLFIITRKSTKRLIIMGQC